MADEAKRRGPRSKTRVTRAIKKLEEEAGGELSKHWRKDFLVALAETSNVTRSAKAANVAPGRAYKVRREEPGFRKAWHEALCEGYDHLEMEVLRRLRDGDFAAADGGKFDFASALRVLTAHRDTVGRQRALDTDADEAAVIASINAKLDIIKEREKQFNAALADDGVYKIEGGAKAKRREC